MTLSVSWQDQPYKAVELPREPYVKYVKDGPPITKHGIVVGYVFRPEQRDPHGGFSVFPGTLAIVHSEGRLLELSVDQLTVRPERDSIEHHPQV